jgi:hypothetical protein
MMCEVRALYSSTYISTINRASLIGIRGIPGRRYIELACRDTHQAIG